jgi:hypothetical protein
MSQENCVKFRAGLIKFLNFFGDFVLPFSGYNDMKPACAPRSDDEAFPSFFYYLVKRCLLIFLLQYIQAAFVSSVVSVG